MKMLKRMKSKLGLTSMALLLLFLTGCQALGGLDLSKALIQMSQEQSMEGNFQISLEMSLNDELMNLVSEEEVAVLELLQSIHLSINELKLQDPTHASVKGELLLSKGSIPFHMAAIGNKMILQLEGAQKPIIINGSMEGLGGALGPLPLTEGIQDKIQEMFPQLSELLIPFLVDKASAPKKLNVSDVTTLINKERLNLKKLQIEMDGVELQGWITHLLTQVLSDKNGLAQLVGQLYDLLGPELLESAAGGNAVISSLISNREYAIPIFVSIIEDLLTNVLIDLDEQEPVEGEPGIGEMLSSVNKMALDVYFDADSHIRKASGQIVIDGTSFNPFVESITVKWDHERWNINKPVQAGLLDTKDALEWNEQAMMTPHEILNLFEEDSLIYQILKNDLKITQITIPMPVGDRNDAINGDVPFIDENNRTLAPARYISEALGAEIKWDGDLRQVTIISADQATTIVLTIDSNIADVNGERVEFDTAAILVPPGYTYVPVRFIIEALGANVKFDEQTRTVFILVQDED